MSKQLAIKPTSKPIQTYYAALQSYGAQGVEHEGALETAFQRLLADTARLKNWTLIPKLKMKVAGKLRIRNLLTVACGLFGARFGW